ncbi:MAG: hypothetical protein LBU83_01345 [Bacteroidales bacterium]|jgi:uncharacterized protein (TIGR02145 family)|nr:hypothetical protein [Bacteroidales bacterium]
MKKIKLFLTAFIAMLLITNVVNLQAQTEITGDFTDPVFAAAVRNAAGLDATDPIFDTDVDGILTLDVSGKGVGSLDGLSWLLGLKELNCSDNNLGGIPPLPPVLEILDCSNNQIAGLPNLTGTLLILDCSNNQIAGLPNLPGTLLILDCGNNQIAGLPDLSPVLEYLDCSNNPLGGLPDFPGTLIHLNCSNNQLPALPGFPGTLEYLNCSHNLLVGLPTLTNLTYLNCSDNDLDGLPTFPGTLEILDIRNNKIDGLQWMISLANLREFYCSGNKLTALHALPGTGGTTGVLEILDCSNNLIGSLSDGRFLIGFEMPTGTWNDRGFPNTLVQINCGGNSITGLDVTGLNSLALLYCGDNFLCSLDKIIGLDEGITTVIFDADTQGDVQPSLKLVGTLPTDMKCGVEYSFGVATDAGCYAGTKVLANVKLTPNVSEDISIFYNPDDSYTARYELKFNAAGEAIFDELAPPDGFEMGDRTAIFYIMNLCNVTAPTAFSVEVELFETSGNTTLDAITLSGMNLLEGLEMSAQNVTLYAGLTSTNVLVVPNPGTDTPIHGLKAVIEFDGDPGLSNVTHTMLTINLSPDGTIATIDPFSYIADNFVLATVKAANAGIYPYTIKIYDGDNVVGKSAATLTVKDPLIFEAKDITLYAGLESTNVLVVPDPDPAADVHGLKAVIEFVGDPGFITLTHSVLTITVTPGTNTIATIDPFSLIKDDFILATVKAANIDVYPYTIKLYDAGILAGESTATLTVKPQFEFEAKDITLYAGLESTNVLVVPDPDPATDVHGLKAVIEFVGDPGFITLTHSVLTITVTHGTNTIATIDPFSLIKDDFILATVKAANIDVYPYTIKLYDAGILAGESSATLTVKPQFEFEAKDITLYADLLYNNVLVVPNPDPATDVHGLTAVIEFEGDPGFSTLTHSVLTITVTPGTNTIATIDPFSLIKDNFILATVKAANGGVFPYTIKLYDAGILAGESTATLTVNKLTMHAEDITLIANVLHEDVTIVTGTGPTVPTMINGLTAVIEIDGELDLVVEHDGLGTITFIPAGGKTTATISPFTYMEVDFILKEITAKDVGVYNYQVFLYDPSLATTAENPDKLVVASNVAKLTVVGVTITAEDILVYAGVEATEVLVITPDLTADDIPGLNAKIEIVGDPGLIGVSHPILGNIPFSFSAGVTTATIPDFTYTKYPLEMGTLTALNPGTYSYKISVYEGTTLLAEDEAELTVTRLPMIVQPIELDAMTETIDVTVVTGTGIPNPALINNLRVEIVIDGDPDLTDVFHNGLGEFVFTYNSGTNKTTATKIPFTYMTGDLVLATITANNPGEYDFTISIYDDYIPGNPNFLLVSGSSKLTVKTPPCPLEYIDAVNGITYDVVTVVGRCWFKQNLASKLYQNGTTIEFAEPYNHPLFPNVVQNEKDFGLLYTYDAAFPSNGSQLCPPGWYIPSTAEFMLLNMHDATTLKNPDFWLKPNANTNTTDFDSRGAGFYNGTTKQYEDMLGYTSYWSSDAASAGDKISCACLNYYCSKIEVKEVQKIDAISVRCIRQDGGAIIPPSCPDAEITGYKPSSKTATLVPGTPVELTVIPNGNPADFDYEWHNTPGAPVGTNSQTYLANAEGSYFCVVTPKCGGNPATSDNFTVTVPPCPSDGVLINGICWAKTNVDMPGTFAATPEDYGMFYQWNRNVGWSTSGEPPVSSNGDDTWDTSIPDGDTWEKKNDPCPTGWCVPTRDELQSLADAGSVWQSSPAGRVFGSGTNTIFLPAAGYRRGTNGELNEEANYGYYWSSTPFGSSGDGAYYLVNAGTSSSSSVRRDGHSVRCVFEPVILPH